jgi:hypothetical protein
MYECECYGIGSNPKAASCGNGFSGFAGICGNKVLDVGTDITGATSMRAMSMCGCSGDSPGIIPESPLMPAARMRSAACGCSGEYVAEPVVVVPDVPLSELPVASSMAFDPMGAYIPEIRMRANSISRGGFMGYNNDGYPVFMSSAVGEFNLTNALATTAICAGGLAFGWVVAGAVLNYFK